MLEFWNVEDPASSLRGWPRVECATLSFGIQRGENDENPLAVQGRYESLLRRTILGVRNLGGILE